MEKTHQPAAIENNEGKQKEYVLSFLLLLPRSLFPTPIYLPYAGRVQK